ncbi:TPA: hypothetical protein I8Y21_002315 [Klebsiella oxytoca]|uniref:Uncharacterized protein n=1 Tax=Klebsiella oxytoca TaxID=571 RepID=A0AAN5RDR5_KLEOX|nr:hypothetical protein [Klebsiella oxytoca]
MRRPFFKLNGQRKGKMALYCLYWIFMVVQSICIVTVVVGTFAVVLRNTGNNTSNPQIWDEQSPSALYAKGDIN